MLTVNITKQGRERRNRNGAKLPNYHTKPRKMGQKICRVEPGTHHIDNDSQASRKTSQHMGRRLHGVLLRTAASRKKNQERQYASQVMDD